ncbi:MAG: glycosyltransferase family 2 protein [Acidobacteriota bacterium]
MLQNRKIAVVIPAYRVEAQIGQVLDKMPDCVDRVFVVDDASPDRVAERLSGSGGRVSLIRHEKNRGVGGATVTGICAALSENCDIVVKCDGDGQMDPRQIPELLVPLLSGAADHAKGCRFHHFGELRQMPRRRLLGNIVLTFLTKLTSGYWNILDPVNGFFATTSEVLREIPLTRLSPRYFFETDFLIRLNIVQARVADVAFPACYGDEKSSLSVTRALFSFPPRLVAGLVRRIFWRYLFYDVSPVAIFSLLGICLCAFGLIFGAYHWITGALNARETGAGTVMLAVLPLILGFQLLLQAIVLDIQNTPKHSSYSAASAHPRLR